MIISRIFSLITRKFFFQIIFLIPTIAFGQLFPSVPDFNDGIEKVVEKRYGREIYLFNKWKEIHLPGFYSGWKYVYHLDKNGKLKRRINKYRGQLRADYIYEYDSVQNVTRKREIINDTINSNKGNYIEDQYMFYLEGEIEKVIVWSFNYSKKLKNILVVEEDIKYDSQGNIVSYLRVTFNNKGEISDRKLYIISYDFLSRVTVIEEKAVGKKTIIVKSKYGFQDFKDILISKPEVLRKWLYEYNSEGQLITSTTKYYGELYKADSNGGQDYKLFFKYDTNDNWIKMYEKLGDTKKRLIAKRKIKYRKSY